MTEDSLEFFRTLSIALFISFSALVTYWYFILGAS